MKLFSSFVLASTMVLPLSAGAGIPFDAAKLGYMRGVLDTCGNVAPQEASAYLMQMKSFVGDATRESVGEAMRTDEYQQAYASIRSSLHDQMSKQSRREAVTTCTSYLRVD